MTISMIGVLRKAHYNGLSLDEPKEEGIDTCGFVGGKNASICLREENEHTFVALPQNNNQMVLQTWWCWWCSRAIMIVLII